MVILYTRHHPKRLRTSSHAAIQCHVVWHGDAFILYGVKSHPPILILSSFYQARIRKVTYLVKVMQGRGLEMDSSYGRQVCSQTDEPGFKPGWSETAGSFLKIDASLRETWQHPPMPPHGSLEITFTLWPLWTFHSTPTLFP